LSDIGISLFDLLGWLSKRCLASLTKLSIFNIMLQSYSCSVEFCGKVLLYVFYVQWAVK